MKLRILAKGLRVSMNIQLPFRFHWWLRGLRDELIQFQYFVSIHYSPAMSGLGETKTGIWRDLQSCNYNASGTTQEDATVTLKDQRLHKSEVLSMGARHRGPDYTSPHSYPPLHTSPLCKLSRTWSQGERDGNPKKISIISPTTGMIAQNGN